MKRSGEGAKPLPAPKMPILRVPMAEDFPRLFLPIFDEKKQIFRLTQPLKPNPKWCSGLAQPVDYFVLQNAAFSPPNFMENLSFAFWPELQRKFEFSCFRTKILMQSSSEPFLSTFFSSNAPFEEETIITLIIKFIFMHPPSPGRGNFSAWLFQPLEIPKLLWCRVKKIRSWPWLFLQTH